MNFYKIFKIVILLTDIIGMVVSIYSKKYLLAIFLLIMLGYLIFIFWEKVDYKNTDNFNKRTLYSSNIIIFCLILLITRLIYIQIFNSKFYRKQIAIQITKEDSIIGNRGKIYDSSGKNLVFNKNVYTIGINPSAIYDRDGKALKGIEELLNENFIIKDKKKLLKEIKNGYKLGRKYKVVAKDIIESEKDEVEKIIKKYGMTRNEIDISKSEERVYYRKEIYSNILGFTGKNRNTKNKIGLFGIEKEYEKYLKYRNIKRMNLYANFKKLKLPMSQKFAETNINGNNVYMTIDNDIQLILSEELNKKFISSESEEAYGIVMEPNTGKILAISSFAKNEKFHRNQIFQNQFEPGSTFKPIVVAEALNRGLITRKTIFNVGDGKITKYGHTIRESSRKTRGLINTDEVLKKSSNVGMVLISERFNDKEFEDMLKKFGFYEKTNVDFPGEIKPTTQSYKRWHGLKRNTMAFGQGIVVTPIQLITAFSAVINGGTLYKPYMVDKIVDENGVVVRRNIPTKVRQVISPKISKDLREILEEVVSDGTAKKGQVAGYKVGGKTGTAQLSSRGGYLKNNYLASFMGFFPADNPKYIVLVMFLKPKAESVYDRYGGATAAPVFANIASRIARTKNILSKNLETITKA